MRLQEPSERSVRRALELLRRQLQALRVCVVDGLGAPLEQIGRPQKQGRCEARGRSLALRVVGEHMLRNAQQRLLQDLGEPRLHLWHPATNAFPLLCETAVHAMCVSTMAWHPA